MTPFRIACFCPAPPYEGAYSPACYAMTTLAPYLKDHCEITYYGARPSALGPSADRLPPGGPLQCGPSDAAPFIPEVYQRAFLDHTREPFDLFLYHVEDSRSAGFSRLHTGLIPGLVWFHDYLLTAHAPESLCDSPWEEVVPSIEALLRMQQARSPALLAPRTKALDRNVPYALREGALAVASVFSNPQAHAEFRRVAAEHPSVSRAVGGGLWHLPLPVTRSGLGSGVVHGSPMVAYCGSPVLHHRPHKVVEALRQIGETAGEKDNPSLVWLLDDAEREAAVAILHQAGVFHYEIVSPRTPDKWRSIVAAATVALHPFFSVYGSVEPYLGISLMAGVPTVVTKFGAADYLPDGLVMKIEAGMHEAASLALVLKSLFSSRESFARMSESLQQYACEVYEASSIAAELLRTLSATKPLFKQCESVWSTLRELSKHALLEEITSILPADEYGELLFAEQILPAMHELGWS